MAVWTPESRMCILMRAEGGRGAGVCSRTSRDFQKISAFSIFWVVVDIYLLVSRQQHTRAETVVRGGMKNVVQNHLDLVVYFCAIGRQTVGDRHRKEDCGEPNYFTCHSHTHTHTHR